MEPPPTPPPPFPGPPQAGGYAPSYGQVQAHTSGMAIGSLISAIVGAVLGFFCCLPAPIGGLVAIILGRNARGSIRRSGGLETGESMATVGEVIGWILVVLGLLGIVAFVALILVGNQTRNVFCNMASGLEGTPRP